MSRISRKKASSRVGGELNEVAFKKEANIFNEKEAYHPEVA